jgi:radical SAM protein
MVTTDAPSRPRSFLGTRPSPGRELDFDVTPFSVVWELTRACDLRCRHCRASAQPTPDPRELTTAEGRDLLRQIRALGSPVFVMTGGDPLKRPDLFALIEHAADIGLPVAVTPSGTSLLTAAALRRMRALGVQRIALSLDGPAATVHDGFRAQPGSFARTVRGAREAVGLGLPVQINTTVHRHNLHLMEATAALVADLSAAMWSVFFLVTVGRARTEDQLTAREFEDVFEFLYDLSRTASFGVRTTAAPHYRRYALQRHARERRDARAGSPPADPGDRTRPWLAGLAGPRATRGVTDGNGIVFVSHTGEVYPSGFLPLVAGSVRDTPLAEIYRASPVLRRLRDGKHLQGKCGICQFRTVCGGSRARAYAVTGDPMAEEPCCLYEPPRPVRARGAAAV